MMPIPSDLATQIRNDLMRRGNYRTAVSSTGGLLVWDPGCGCDLFIDQIAPGFLVKAARGGYERRIPFVGGKATDELINGLIQAIALAEM